MLAKGKHHQQATQEPGVRAFLEERGFRPTAEQKLGERATALRIFPLDEVRAQLHRTLPHPTRVNHK